MSVLCEHGEAEDELMARRQHVLQVFALLEHPDALPAEVALRLRYEVRALTRLPSPQLRSDAALPPEGGITSAF